MLYFDNRRDITLTRRLNMNTDHYQEDISVTASATEVYHALTQGFSQWWTKSDESFETAGDQVTFRFPPQVSYWTFEAEILIPDQYIELECVEAHHVMLDKPNAPTDEWMGSFLCFTIEEQGEETRVTFIHKGLTPQQKCYKTCAAGWNHFFVNSLKNYLCSGTGMPHK